MKLKNVSTRSISVMDPLLERGVTVEPGAVGAFSELAGADLLASFPSDWELVPVDPPAAPPEP